MKVLLISVITILIFSVGANAQSLGFFKPKPLPSIEKVFSAVNDTTVVVNKITKNFVRPVIGVTATESNGVALAGGFGVSLQHNIYDLSSASWIIQYEVSAIGFIGTNGSKITGTAGLVFGVPGTNGIVQLGAGRDFTQGQFVLLTGVAINL